MWCLTHKINDETRALLFHVMSDLLEYASDQKILIFTVEFLPIWEPKQIKSQEELEEQARKRRGMVLPTPLSRSKED